MESSRLSRNVEVEKGKVEESSEQIHEDILRLREMNRSLVLKVAPTSDIKRLIEARKQDYEKVTGKQWTTRICPFWDHDNTQEANLRIHFELKAHRMVYSQCMNSIADKLHRFGTGLHERESPDKIHEDILLLLEMHLIISSNIGYWPPTELIEVDEMLSARKQDFKNATGEDWELLYPPGCDATKQFRKLRTKNFVNQLTVAGAIFLQNKLDLKVIDTTGPNWNDEVRSYCQYPENALSKHLGFGPRYSWYTKWT